MITLFIGKSASGKDTFCRRLHEESNGQIKLIVSSTTRPPRIKEVNGRDYNFETIESFLKKVDNGDIIEYRKYNAIRNGEKVEWYYGSPKVDPKENWTAVIEINGALAYIDTYGSGNLDIIYVHTDESIRESRARQRGSFDKAEWDRRLVADDADFSYENLKKLITAYGKPIKTLNNNSDTPLYSQINITDFMD